MARGSRQNPVQCAIMSERPAYCCANVKTTLRKMYEYNTFLTKRVMFPSLRDGFILNGIHRPKKGNLTYFSRMSHLNFDFVFSIVGFSQSWGQKGPRLIFIPQRSMALTKSAKWLQGDW
jgi:hypothetical protein